MTIINFTGQLDLPNALPGVQSGDAGKVVAVNETETGYRLIAPPALIPAQNEVRGVVVPPVIADGIADDTAIIQAALDFLASNGGGVCRLPAGTMRTTSTLNVSPMTRVVGLGMSTILKYDPPTAGTAVRLGAVNAPSLQYGMAITDMDIVLVKPNSVGVRLSATCGAEVHRIFVEALSVNAGHTAFEIVGGTNNTSNFFNSFRDVQGHHMHIGVKFTRGPSSYPTRTEFDNVRFVGDATAGDASSAAYLFAENAAGQDSVIRGGYVENFMTGVYALPGIAISGVKFFGLSFENGHPNAADVDISKASAKFGFYGCFFRRTVSLQGTGHVNM